MKDLAVEPCVHAMRKSRTANDPAAARRNVSHLSNQFEAITGFKHCLSYQVNSDEKDAIATTKQRAKIINRVALRTTLRVHVRETSWNAILSYALGVMLGRSFRFILTGNFTDRSVRGIFLACISSGSRKIIST